MAITQLSRPKAFKRLLWYGLDGFTRKSGGARSYGRPWCRKGQRLPRLSSYRTLFSDADANDLILQMRTWESNNVGVKLPFNGDVEAALRSIKVEVLYMPSATDLYFPVTDARYEAQFIHHCTLIPIPSVWGHPAGAGQAPEDGKFVNRHIAAFMDGR